MALTKFERFSLSEVLTSFPDNLKYDEILEILSDEDILESYNLKKDDDEKIIISDYYSVDVAAERLEELKNASEFYFS